MLPALKNKKALGFFVLIFCNKIKKARSPLLVHVNNTIEGIHTIRASRNNEILIREFNELNDDHTRAFFGYIVLSRWFGLRIDFLTMLFTIATLFSAILLKGIHL
jgi:ATP-binding cassette subfamily C (CFTR/MRP) protein 4